MNNDDSYKIVFTNEMLRSIGIDTKNDNIEVEITIENGNIKVCRKEDDI